MTPEQRVAAKELVKSARDALDRSRKAGDQLHRAYMLTLDLWVELGHERRNRYFPRPNESATKVDALIEEIKGVLRGE